MWVLNLGNIWLLYELIKKSFDLFSRQISELYGWSRQKAGSRKSYLICNQLQNEITVS